MEFVGLSKAVRSILLKGESIILMITGRIVVVPFIAANDSEGILLSSILRFRLRCGAGWTKTGPSSITTGREFVQVKDNAEHNERNKHCTRAAEQSGCDANRDQCEYGVSHPWAVSAHYPISPKRRLSISITRLNEAIATSTCESSGSFVVNSWSHSPG